MGAEPESLDPVAMASSPSATISQHISQTLVYLDVDGTLRPNLAEAWETAPDGLSWTLSLRQNVQFHDGTPFNAEAVKFNLDRFLNPDNAAPFRFLIERIVNVEVVDEFTVRLHLEKPFAPLLSHLSHAFIGMISPAALQALPAGEKITLPVGTGPFRIVSWDKGDKVVLERNPAYWGEQPKLEKVTFRFVPEAASRIVMLETGEAQAIMSVPPAEAPRLRQNQDLRVVNQTGVRLIYIGINNQRGPLADPRVRQALNYAIDKETLVQTVLAGSGQPSTAPVVPAVFGHTPAGPYAFNLDKAKQLLAEAGYADGFSVNLYHPTGRYVMDATIAEAVQGMLKEIGVTAELKTMEWGTYLQSIRKPPAEATHDLYMLGWGTVTLDADYGLYSMFHSAQWPATGWNVSFYKNEQVDELLTAGRNTPDREERKRIYSEVIPLIWQDAPWIFLHDEMQINAERANVSGLIHHPLENIFTWNAEIR